MDAFTPDIKGIRTPATTNPRIVKPLVNVKGRKRRRGRGIKKVHRRGSLPFEL